MRGADSRKRIFAGCTARAVVRYLKKTTADFRPHFPVDCSNRPAMEFRLVCWADSAADHFVHRTSHAPKYKDTARSSNMGKTVMALRRRVTNRL